MLLGLFENLRSGLTTNKRILLYPLLLTLFLYALALEAKNKHKNQKVNYHLFSAYSATIGALFSLLGPN